ncbi:MAG: class I SAM-dependent methyltransferase [Zoogloeaceae bacterium]|jgi:SAM-dependent methyltransferase|nr:class I SAM-dependent methyltransferase [Zoogloeaceae bacterium]
MSIPGLDSWLETPQGRYVLHWEQSRLDAALADVFGFNALQIGLSRRDFLRANRIPLRAILDDATPEDGLPLSIQTVFTHLPIAAQSVDLVVLPHVLEFYPEPHRILREVERVLRPEGQLFILGFNPRSLWGLFRRLSGRARDFPWNGQYLSVPRLKDWLKLLGFELDRGAFGCYAPPCTREKWLEHWRFLELAGNRWWGFAGSVYMVRAIKRVCGMRLIVPTWNSPQIKAKALTPIVRKEHPDD